MKYLLALVGSAISWGIYQYFPEAFTQLIKVSGFYGGLTTILAVLTAGWVICLSRISTFDKLEDLPNSGRDKIISYSKRLRIRIIGTIVFNVILAFVLFAAIFAAQVEALDGMHLGSAIGYVICITLGFCLGGSLDSWRCYNAIEGTKEEFILAQLEMKARKAFLEKLRKDAQEKPVARDDLHLNGYTKNV